ncbi:hypothetical protein P8452_29605 [Trifolium repens]|nr:hypothetical protein P8452_29605 [Trifolium repens]
MQQLELESDHKVIDRDFCFTGAFYHNNLLLNLCVSIAHFISSTVYGHRLNFEPLRIQKLLRPSFNLLRCIVFNVTDQDGNNQVILDYIRKVSLSFWFRL